MMLPTRVSAPAAMRMVPVPCARCGSPITGRRSNAKYCSSNCERQARRARASTHYEANNRGARRRRRARREADGSLVTQCAECHGSLTGMRLGTKYCSIQCRERASRRRHGKTRRQRHADRWSNDKAYRQRMRAMWQRNRTSWIVEHPAQRQRHNRMSAQRRRAQVRGARCEPFGLGWMGEQLERQRGACQHCRQPFSNSLRPTIDHVVPLARGGDHAPTNCQLLCKSCNSRKGAKLETERTALGVRVT